MIGAFGLHAYGLTRATQDLDFVVESWVQPKLIDFLEKLGYETLHVSSGYSHHLHQNASFGRVDFVYVDNETARRLFDAAREALEIEGLRVPVPRAEHLAAMKVQAMKNDPSRTLQELADIQFLMRLPGLITPRSGAILRRPGLPTSMTSLRDYSDHREIDWSVPTTPADVAALRRRPRAKPDTPSYLRFLAGFPPPPRERLKARKGPAGEPFLL